jgi:hypothetical protein
MVEQTCSPCQPWESNQCFGKILITFFLKLSAMKQKHILILLFTLVAFAGCKQLYDPEITVDQSALVIEARLTSTPGELMVKISKAVNYDSDSADTPVPNCIVTVKEGENKIYFLTDNGDGSYSDTSLFAQEGQTYSLNVVTADGDEYQSGDQVLPPIYTQDSIYTAKVNKEELVYTDEGYYKTVNPYIEIYANLSSGSTEMPKCMYVPKVTVLYSIGEAHFTSSVNYSSEINLTTSTYENTQGSINKHTICVFGSSPSKYSDDPNALINEYKISLTKYSLTPEAYQYYKSEKEQLEATGKIFDPIPAQVHGNIKCVNNIEKSVYGFFEVTNVEKFKYVCSVSWAILTPVDESP